MARRELEQADDRSADEVDHREMGGGGAQDELRVHELAWLGLGSESGLGLGSGSGLGLGSGSGLGLGSGLGSGSGLGLGSGLGSGSGLGLEVVSPSAGRSRVTTRHRFRKGMRQDIKMTALVRVRVRVRRRGPRPLSSPCQFPTRSALWASRGSRRSRGTGSCRGR